MELMWVELQDFPMYEVSILGVRRKGMLTIMPPIKERNGYLRVYVRKEGTKNKYGKGQGRVWVKIHRAIAQAFIPNPENKPTVNHINGIKNDNRVENLEWATYIEQSQHARNTGLYRCLKGEQVWKAKLTNDDVKDIRAMWAIGKTKIEIWKKYSSKVTRGRIYSVINNRGWLSVK